MAYLYPWGNTQELNLDWIIQKIKELENGGASGADIEEIANVLVALTYRSANTYQRYDYAFYNGKLYRATANTTGVFNPSDWLEVQIGNDVAILTRLVNAVDASLTTLQGQVADLDTDDVDNASNVTGATASDALNNLNGAISDLTPPNNIGLVGQQNYNTIKSNLSGSGTSEIFIINETENNNWSYIESLISGTHKYAILSGQNGVVTFRSTDSGTTWRMIKLSNDNYATVEYGTNATKAYVVGEYVIVDSVLYRVKSAISNGATFTVDTNIESTTVGDELKSLLVPVEHTLTAQTGITVGSMQCYTLGKLCFIRINNTSFGNDGNSQALITGVPQPLIQTGATGIAGSNAVNTGAIMSAGDTAYIEASTDIIRFHVNASTKSYAHWFSFVYLTK